MNKTGQPQPPLPGEHEQEGNHLNRLYKTFIDNVGHELRTPLTIILGYAETLCQGHLGVLAPEQEEAVVYITTTARELHKLVEQINTLLEVEAHAGTALPVVLAEIVADALEKSRPAATQAGLELKAELEPELAPISGNPQQLRQVVDCLLDNAIKFTPRGGQVKVRLYAEADRVVLAVIDNGIGIATDELKHLFSGFHQVDGSPTRRYGGIGLGLTLVRTVIEKHMGRIEVTSQPAQGSQFTIKFPAQSTEAQPIQSAQIEPAAGSVPPRRILIVDDEKNVAQILQDGLETLPNCHVEVASGGEQALQLFEQRPFDLLITDYKMPGMDGMTLATQVRQLRPQTAVVMITAYGSDALYEQAGRAAIEHVLAKPVGLPQIRRTASSILERTEGVANER